MIIVREGRRRRRRSKKRQDLETMKTRRKKTIKIDSYISNLTDRRDENHKKKNIAR